MANQFTTPVQSQFVPTYAPINIQAVNAGARALQQRQDENFAILDELGEKMLQTKKSLLSEDEAIYENKIGAIRKQLDGIASDGDVSDARRQIRGLASRYQEELISGDVGRAMGNFEQVQNAYKKIDETDLSGPQKDALKQSVIENYQGVGSGGLDLASPTNALDGNKFAEDVIGDWTPQEVTTFLQTPEGRDIPWQFDSTTGKFMRGEQTTKKLPRELARAMMQRAIANDPQALAALRQRAKIQTVGQDEFETTDEDGNPTVMSKQDMQDRLVQGYITNMADLQAGLNTSTDIDMTAHSVTPSRFSSMARILDTKESGFSGHSTKLPGVTVATDIGVDNFEDGFNTALSLQNSADPKERQRGKQLEANLRNSFSSFANSSDKYNQEDYEFMQRMRKRIGEIEEDQKKRSISTGSGVPFLGGAEGAASVGAGVPKYTNVAQLLREQLGEDDLKKYQTIQQDFNNWVDKGGGFTETLHTPDGSKDGNDAFSEAGQAIARSPVGAFTIYGMDDTNAKEYLSETIDTDTGKTRFDTFQLQGFVEAHDGLPLRAQGTVLDENGEEKLVQIVQKRDPSWGDSSPDMMDSILQNSIGGQTAQNLVESRRFQNLMPTYDYKNDFETLPSSIRRQSTNSYVGVKRKGRNQYTVQYGDEDNPDGLNEIKDSHVIMNLYNMPSVQDPESMLNQIDRHGVLTPEEKGIILDGEINEAIRRKLEQQFNSAFTFSSPRTAAKVGALTPQ